MKRPSSPPPGGLPASDDETLALSRSLRALAVALVTDEATADDLVQEAWLAVLESRALEVRRREPWLRQVVRNLAQDWWRRSTRQREVEAFWAPDESIEEAPELDTNGNVRLLRETVDELREPYRSVLLERFFEERPVAEIAERLGRPYETVKSQVQRGIGDLREALDRKHRGERTDWMRIVLPLAALGPREAAPAPAGPRLARHVPPALVAGLAGVTLLGTVALVAGGGEGLVRSARSPALAGSPRVEPASPGEVPDPGAPAPENNRALVAVAERADPAADSITGTAPVTVRVLELTVRDSSGRLVARPEVEVMGAHGLLETRHGDETGRVRVEVPEDELEGPPRIPGPHGGVGVTARAPGEAWSPVFGLALPPEGRVHELTTLGPSQTVVGHVLDEDFWPVEGATVVVERQTEGIRFVDGIPLSERRARAHSDAEGAFTLAGLPRREHRLLVRAAGTIPVRAIAHGDQDELEVELIVRRGATVRGTVRDPYGRPVAGARVWEVGATAGLDDLLPRVTADASGGFELTGLEPGPRRLFACDALDPGRFDEIVLEATASEGATWDALLHESPGVRVRVETSAGEPVEGVAVLLSLPTAPYWTGSEVTGPDGRVHVRHVPQGALGLGLLHQWTDHEARLVLDELTASDEERLVRLDPDEAPRATLRGSVVDAEDRILAGVPVVLCLAHEFRHATTDANGAFVFEGLSAGTCELWATVPGRGVFEMGVHELVAGDALDLGPRRAPRPRTVSLPWSPRSVGPDAPWLLEGLARRRPRNGAHVARLEERHDTWALQPGRYRLRPLDPRNGTTVTFEVTSAGETRVDAPE